MSQKNIFISYSSKDLEIVKAIQEALEEFGIIVLTDKEFLIGGEDWENKIINKLKETKHVLLICSENSLNPSSYVKKELAYALSNNKWTIVVRLDQAEPISNPENSDKDHENFSKVLQKLHWLDMSNWKPGQRLPADLIKTLKELKLIPLSGNWLSRRDFFATGLGIACLSGLSASALGVYKTASASFPEIEWELINVVSNTYGFPADSYLVKQSELFINRIDEMTHGRFKIRFSEIGESDKPLTELLKKNNNYDCAYSSIYLQEKEQHHDEFLPLYFRYAIPFGLSPEGQMAWLFEGDRDSVLSKRQILFRDTLKFKGTTERMISFPIATTGFQLGLWINQKIPPLTPEKNVNQNSPDNSSLFKNLKFRMSGIGAAVFSEFGADVSPLVGEECTSAQIRVDCLSKLLEEGKLDAAEWLAIEDDIDKLHFDKALVEDINNPGKKSQLYLYYPAWWEPSTTFDIHIKESSWNELGPKYQRLVKLVCMELYLDSWAHYVSTNAQKLKLLKKNLGDHLIQFDSNFIHAGKTKRDEVLIKLANSNNSFQRIYQEWSNFKSEYDEWQEFIKIPNPSSDQK